MQREVCPTHNPPPSDTVQQREIMRFREQSRETKRIPHRTFKDDYSYQSFNISMGTRYIT